jgi:CHAD domain-containing protein
MAKPWKVVDLDPNESAKVCLHKIALTRFQETFSYQQGTLERNDIEALHDMRVSARRLRAILKIFRRCFPKKRYIKQDAVLQSLIRHLGAVREKDVFIELLSGHRNTLAPRDARAFDLLMAHESVERLAHQKLLTRHLRALERSKYQDSFERFLKEHL